MAREEAARYTALAVDYVGAVTDKAVLVGYEGREIWIPKSCIFENDVPEERSSKSCCLNIQDWFAKRQRMV